MSHNLLRSGRPGEKVTESWGWVHVSFDRAHFRIDAQGHIHGDTPNQRSIERILTLLDKAGKHALARRVLDRVNTRNIHGGRR